MTKRGRKRSSKPVGPPTCFNCGTPRDGKPMCKKCGHWHKDYSDISGSDTGRGHLWSSVDRGTDNEDTD